MKNFTCKVCGKSHKLYTLIEAPKPEIFGRITSGELNQQMDVIAKSVFLINREYGLFESELKVNIENSEDDLELFVWVKIDGKSLSEIVNNSERKGIINIQGQLIGVIPFYSSGLNVIIEIDLDKDESAKISEVIDKSKLKIDFENGISSNQMIEMYTEIYHPD